jgi:homopolymeric O-antigen transport system permease protein
MNVTTPSAEIPVLPRLPTLRITPPSRWWVIPFGELWDFRELLYFFVWRDIKVRYKQTAIGAAWAVLQPFLTMLIFSLFFGRLAHIPSEGLPYPIFYYSALLPWTYFATSLQNATNTIVDNQRVITKVYFPRLTLPLSSVLSGLVDFGISFLMFVAMMFYYGMRPRATALWLPVFLLLAVLTALGVGLWLSALNAVYRDVKYAITFLIQFWMFASPVAYPSSLVPAKWRWLYGLNPMAGVIEGFRWSLAGGGEAPGRLILASSGMVLLILLGGIAYFQKMEATVSDVV